MNAWFLMASGAAALTCLIHLFGGGRLAAKPLLQVQGLSEAARFTAFYAWHLVTIALGGMALAFLRAGLFAGGREMAASALVFAIAAFAWNVAMISRWKLSWIKFPQWFFSR